MWINNQNTDVAIKVFNKSRSKSSGGVEEKSFKNDFIGRKITDV